MKRLNGGELLLDLTSLGQLENGDITSSLSEDVKKSLQEILVINDSVILDVKKPIFIKIIDSWGNKRLLSTMTLSDNGILVIESISVSAGEDEITIYQNLISIECSDNVIDEISYNSSATTINL